MKVLIVAHPDDEILWFTPQSFDLIVIAFLARHDKPYAKHCREKALAEHPFKEKIISLDIDESGFWKDKSRVKQYQASREKLFESLLKLKQEYSFTKIFTHNSEGEYGHDDHILVNEAVTALFSEVEIFYPIDANNYEGQGKTISILNNLELYNQIKAIYVKNKAGHGTVIIYHRHSYHIHYTQVNK